MSLRLVLIITVAGIAACGGRTPSGSGPDDGAPTSSSAPTGDDANAPQAPLPPPTLAEGGSGCDDSAGEVPANPAMPAGTIEIPATHPRLWWTPERLKRARKWYKKAGWRPKGRPYYGDDYLDHAFVYMMTGDKKAGRKAVDWALGIELQTRHPGNDARWYGEAAILIYDWCHDLMTDAERAGMIKNWNVWLAEFNEHSWGGLHMPRNNYYWGFLRNSLLWGIATEGENPQAASFREHALVTRWKESFVPYAAKDGIGGVPTEGAQYGQYPLWYSVVGFMSAACLGRTLYNESRFFRDAVYWAIYNTPNGPTVRPDSKGKAMYDLFPYADDEFWHEYASAQRTEIGDFMTAAAMTWRDHPVGKYARAWLERVDPKRRAFVRASDPGAKVTVALKDLPLDYYAPGAGYLWVRTGWDESDTIAMFHGSSKREAHEHYDASQFQLWRGGRWLTRELVSYTHKIVGLGGKGERQDAGEGLGHNVVVFNARGQVWPEYRIGAPEVKRLLTNEQFAYMGIELSDSYKSKVRPQVHNPYVSSHAREMVFLRGLETLVVIDRWAVPDVGEPPPNGKWKPIAATEIPVTFLTHFESEPPAAKGGRFVYETGDQALQQITLYPPKATFRVVDEDAQVKVGVRHRASTYRVEVEVTGQREGYFVHVLQARGKSEADVKASLKDTGKAFEVTLTHPKKGTAMVVFDKGMSVSGGSVGCFAGKLPCADRTALPATVKPPPPVP